MIPWDEVRLDQVPWDRVGPGCVGRFVGATPSPWASPLPDRHASIAVRGLRTGSFWWLFDLAVVIEIVTYGEEAP
jgi:hypothetical protein